MGTQNPKARRVPLLEELTLKLSSERRCSRQRKQSVKPKGERKWPG